MKFKQLLTIGLIAYGLLVASAASASELTAANRLTIATKSLSSEEKEITAVVAKVYSIPSRDYFCEAAGKSLKAITPGNSGRGFPTRL